MALFGANQTGNCDGRGFNRIPDCISGTNHLLGYSSSWSIPQVLKHERTVSKLLIHLPRTGKSTKIKNNIKNSISQQSTRCKCLKCLNWMHFGIKKGAIISPLLVLIFIQFYSTVSCIHRTCIP